MQNSKKKITLYKKNPNIFIGRGEDCHRTWESVLLGAIPAVSNSSGLWPLFAAAPVMVVGDWDGGGEGQFLHFQVRGFTRREWGGGGWC